MLPGGRSCRKQKLWEKEGDLAIMLRVLDSLWDNEALKAG
jgi:hypothetical protein